MWGFEGAGKCRIGQAKLRSAQTYPRYLYRVNAGSLRGLGSYLKHRSFEEVFSHTLSSLASLEFSSEFSAIGIGILQARSHPTPPRTMSSPKVALITAASTGLGAAIARTLVIELGMSVVINYHRNTDRAAKLVQELQDDCGVRYAKSGAPVPVVKMIQADVGEKSDVYRLVEKAAEEFDGRLDVVISNVGWTRMRNFSDLEDGLDEEDWDRCFAANVKSHLWLFHAAKKYLEESNQRERGAAVFVSTASVAGVKPSGSSLVSSGYRQSVNVAANEISFDHVVLRRYESRSYPSR